MTANPFMHDIHEYMLMVWLQAITRASPVNECPACLMTATCIARQPSGACCSPRCRAHRTRMGEEYMHKHEGKPSCAVRHVEMCFARPSSNPPGTVRCAQLWFRPGGTTKLVHSRGGSIRAVAGLERAVSKASKLHLSPGSEILHGRARTARI